MRFLSIALLLVSAATALGQWIETQKLGIGGEAFVSTDGKGGVFATCHLPSKLFVSRDFGKTFGAGLDLPESMCDVCSTVGPNGKLYVIYIRPNVSGMQLVKLSPDDKSIVKAGVLAGSYDREWLVADPKTGQLGFDYSDGYIGGPKSKGVFYATSTDDGATFKTISRIDQEPADSYPVDPYLTIGTGGRIYAAWAITHDQDKIDGYGTACSDDGGKTWKNHTQIATTHGSLGDIQERWMLGSIAAIGKDTAMMLYQDYTSLEVDGQEVKPLLAYYRLTTDGGKTWSPSKTCLSAQENEQAIHQFLDANGKAGLTSTYCQALPWISADKNGRVHLALVDNRSGSQMVSDKVLGLWQVRYSKWTNPSTGFVLSERVSHDWAAIRPPLDFVGCCSDGANAWVIWTENPSHASGWDFSGDFFIAHKKL